MALGRGITVMGRGADIDPESFRERQLMADRLYQQAVAAPVRPETSWTQGMARVLQSGVSGYEDAQIKNDRRAYNELQADDMQKLSAALGGGDYKSIIGQLRSPQAQIMAFQLAHENMSNANKYRQERELKEWEFGKKREEKADDRNWERNFYKEKNRDTQDFEYGKLERQQRHDFERDDRQAALKREARFDDPVKDVQHKISLWQRVVADPDAPPEYKALAQKQLESEKSTMVAVQPPKSQVNVNMGGPGETKMEEAFGKKVGDTEAERQSNNIKYGQLANDQLSTFGRIDGYIKDGTLGNLQTTTLGQGLQTAAARLGLPNDSGQIADFIQSTAQQLVDMRKLLAGQGQISNYEQTLLKNTALNPQDTLQAVQQKLFVFQQLANRVKQIGEITTQWKDRFGGLIRKGPNGESYDSVVQKLIQATPIISYQDMMKRKSEEASAQEGYP